MGIWSGSTYSQSGLDPANPVLSISFVEVTHRRNRELLKRYIRYGLGITNLSVGVIRGELIYLRSFLNDIQQPEDTDICSVTPAQMEAYFRVQRQRGGGTGGNLQ